jgi:predicted  nucleic acid-binding Zn-ribbon protein
MDKMKRENDNLKSQVVDRDSLVAQKETKIKELKKQLERMNEELRNFFSLLLPLSFLSFLSLLLK